MPISRREFLITSGVLTAGFAVSEIGTVLAQSPEFYKKIEVVEDEIRTKDIENGYFFNDNGSIILQKTGGQDAVGTPKEDWPKVMNSTYTHNHPPFVLVKGKLERTFLPLSVEDLNFAGLLRLKEIRAVSVNPDNKKKTLSWAKRGNLVYWPDFPVDAMYHKISDTYYKLGGKWYDGEKFDWNIVIKAINSVYSGLAKKLGFEYGYKEWK